VPVLDEHVLVVQIDDKDVVGVETDHLVGADDGLSLLGYVLVSATNTISHELDGAVIDVQLVVPVHDEFEVLFGFVQIESEQVEAYLAFVLVGYDIAVFLVTNDALNTFKFKSVIDVNFNLITSETDVVAVFV